VIARPGDGGVLILDRVSALIWTILDTWQDEQAVERAVEHEFPDVDVEERRAAVAHVVSRLDEEGLIERRPS
jgi:hypothetical protein